MWIIKFYASSIGKKTTMAISGLGLCVFILLHTLGNASALFGRRAYIAYATHLHGLGPLLSIAEAGLFFFFLVHIATGITLYLQNLGARPTRYAVAKKKDVSPTARLMPYTGLVTLVFLVTHLYHFQAAASRLPVADRVHNLLSQPFYAMFYMTGVLAVALHLGHGAWSLWQTLGINHPKYNDLLQKGAITLGVAVGFVLFLLPALSLLVKGFLL